MLIGEDFGGRHNACLIAIIDRQQCCQQCYNRFAAAYIALQQAIHLFARLEVALYLT